MRIATLATGSSGNSCVLGENNQIVLLDLGVGLPEIKRGIKYRVSDIVVAFVSHAHLSTTVNPR